MRGRTPEQQIRDAERRKQALELKRAGLTYDEIAVKMGYSHRGQAQQLVKRAIRDLWIKPAEDVRALEVERLDKNHDRCERLIKAHIEEACQKGVIAKDKESGEMRYVIATDAVKAVLGAIKSQAEIAARRAKYLGLDAPEKKDVTLRADATPAEARRIMQELFGGNVGPVAADGAETGAPDALGAPEGTPTH